MTKPIYAADQESRQLQLSGAEAHRKLVHKGSTYPQGIYPDADANLRLKFRQEISQTKKPEAFPGMNDCVPTDRNGFKVIGRYDYPGSLKAGRPYIYCSACGTGHLTGVAVWFPDGWLRPIGHQCGDKHFDAGQLQREIDAFDEVEDRRRQAEYFAELRGRLPALIQELGETSLNASAAHLDEFVGALRFKAKDGYNRLVSAVKSGGVLAIRDDSDSGVSEMFREAAQMGRSSGRGGRANFKPIGRINAKKLLTPQGAKGILATARTELQALDASSRVEGTQDTKGMLAQARNVVVDLSDVRDKFLQAAEFTHESTLKLVEVFLNDSSKVSYVRVPGGIVVRSSSAPVRVTLNPAFRQFGFEATSAFARAIGAKF